VVIGGDKLKGRMTYVLAERKSPTPTSPDIRKAPSGNFVGNERR
jgi:hypothetical protein